MRILSLFLGLLLAAVSVTPASAEDSFTLAVLPDTQGEIHANGSPTGIFFQRAQWLLSNRTALNLKCMLQVGDLVNFYNYRQYEAVSTGLKSFDDAGLPYTMALGNHDTAAVGEWTGAAGAGKTGDNVRVTQYYNSYFPLSRFTMLKGVYEADKIDNSFHTFAAGDLDWLVLSLELWPRAAVYDWAKAVIASHPNHNVIIVTHAYMTSGGGIQQDNGGYGATSPQMMLDQLVKPYANVRFVFCGHVGSNNYRTDTGTNGNKIYSFLQNEVGGKGHTRLITINTKTGTIGSRIHSVVDNVYLTGASNFTVTGVSWVPRNTPAAPRIAPPTPARKTVNPGQTVTFAVRATGSPAPTFQWQKNGANISGATSASYTTPAIASGDNGAAFRCVVTNSAGTATSSTAIVKTSVAPAITTQPASQTAALGANTIFFVNVSGDPWPTYQWQRNGVNLPGNGAKAPRYEIRGVVAGDHGAVFRCIVTNIAGTVTSNSATLSVSGVTTSPPTITSQPTSQTRAVGQTATFTVAANGAPAPTYQWQRGTTNISGATSASYTTPALTSSDNGATFRCVVKNSVGSATSNSATLTVTTSTVAPIITTQPVARTVNVGQTATFSVVATGTPAPTYQWQRGTTNISGATAASYTTPATVAGDNGATFRCVVSNSAGTATSNSATLTVNTGSAVIGTGTGLSGAYFNNQDLTGTAVLRRDPTVNFTWAEATAPISGVAAGTYSIRWAGQVQAQYSQTYTFFTTSDDGVRLRVNGQLLVDQWNDHGPTEHSGTIAMTAGTRYNIELEFYQAMGGARIALMWSSPSTAKQLVPTTQLYPAGLSSAWAAQDFGSGTQAGSAYVTGDTAVVTGAGGDIFKDVDGGRMLTQALTGDGTIITRVVSMTNTNPWAKAGIMIREGTAANAKHAFCFVTPVTTNGVGFIRRTATGGMSTYTGGSKNTAPRWLRLVRSGTTITASESADGNTWTTVGTVTVSLANPVRIGFAVTAGDNSKLCTAVFDVVSITPAGNG